MKQLIFLLSLTCIFNLNVGAQTAPVNRGTYGTQSDYFGTAMHLTTYAGVVKTRDTLTNGDTGYMYIWVGQGYGKSFDMTTTTLSGTVASTSNILYGVNNNGLPLTAAQVATVTTTGTTAFAITGNTTYCAGCVGASSTTVPGALKHYMWQVPNNAGAQFDNYIIRTIQTGTATATYTSKVTTQY